MERDRFPKRHGVERGYTNIDVPPQRFCLLSTFVHMILWCNCNTIIVFSSKSDRGSPVPDILLHSDSDPKLCTSQWIDATGGRKEWEVASIYPRAL